MSTESASTEAPYDVVASFVLFHTERSEIERTITQMRAANARTMAVLVDNSVPPLDLAWCEAPDVRVIRSGGNIGYGRGHNRAITSTVGLSRYHIVMNTDLTYGAGVIEGLVTFMDQHPSVGLSMPKVRYPDGRIQRLCRLLPNPLDPIGRRFFGFTRWSAERNRRYELHDWGYDSVASFPFLSGCFMMLRRDVLDSIGGFDERYFLYAEDLDLSRRMHAVSETLFVPHVEVVHDYRSEKRRSVRSLLYGVRSLSQYFWKWGWVFDPERERINRATLAALDRQPR